MGFGGVALEGAGIFLVIYFQNLVYTLAGFSNIAYPTFNKLHCKHGMNNLFVMLSTLEMMPESSLQSWVKAEESGAECTVQFNARLA